MVVRNVIVIVVDGLGAGALGPYGNTWIDTPNINRFAAGAALFEFAMSDSPRLPVVYRSIWHGCHAAAVTCEAASLPERLLTTDIHSALLTDEAEIANSPPAGCFSERLFVEPSPQAHTAASIEQTGMAKLFAGAVEWLDSAPQPFLFWLHSRGMRGPWDAPLEFRNSLADEDDPVPPKIVEPPARVLSGDVDPDELLGISQSYAGQVLLLDACLGALFDAVENANFGHETAIVLTAPRGFPLGEHGVLGDGEPNLFEESLHIPLMLRMPAGQFASVREPSLAQPSDVAATVLDLLGLFDGPDTAAAWGRSLVPVLAGDGQNGADCAFANSDQQYAFRTPAWLLVQLANQDARLYVKPDDRWEVNEVADRCRDVVEQMEIAAENFQSAAEQGDRNRLTPLNAKLTEPPD